MTSIVFTAPRHFDVVEVRKWAPGELLAKNKPLRLLQGDYVYVSHRHSALFRAKFLRSRYLDSRITVDGEDRGPGWFLEIGQPEFPPRQVPLRGHTGFGYTPELW